MPVLEFTSDIVIVTFTMIRTAPTSGPKSIAKTNFTHLRHKLSSFFSSDGFLELHIEADYKINGCVDVSIDVEVHSLSGRTTENK